MSQSLTPEQIRTIRQHPTFFDPRIINENEDNRRLWNTKSVDLAIQGLADGYNLIESPFNRNIKDANLRKCNLSFRYSDEEIETITLCMNDKIFYGNTFGKLKTPSGWRNITLRDYQENLLRRYTDNRWNLIMFPRQSGKTTTTIVDIAHYMTFNYDKDMAIIAQSQKVVDEIMAKLKQFFDNMTFFLQPGFVKYTKDKIITDNNCRLTIGVASESVIQGFSLNYLYVDEVAYIKEKMWYKFWDNVYPSLSADPDSRVIITSTPNGRNHFSTLWSDAVAGRNEFSSYRIYWTDVPRVVSHEEFKRQTIANSTINAWYMGYECSFDVGMKTIFSTNTQLHLRHLQDSNQCNWEDYDNPVSRAVYAVVPRDTSTKVLMKKDVDIDYDNDYFIMSVDISEGLCLDRSVLKINKISRYDGKDVDNSKLIKYHRNKVRLVQCGVIYTNTMSVQTFAEVVLNVMRCFNTNRIKLVLEYNTYGAEFVLSMKTLVKYVKKYSKFSLGTVLAKFVRPTLTNKSNREVGIRWSAESKRMGVKYVQDVVEDGLLEVSQWDVVEEYLNFGLQSNGTYKANYGNDDLIMSDVSTAYFLCNKDESVSTDFISNAKAYLSIKDDSEGDETSTSKKYIYTRNGFTQRTYDDVTESSIQDQEIGYIYVV